MILITNVKSKKSQVKSININLTTYSVREKK